MRLALCFFLASACYGQSQALQQYLGLTVAQVSAIAKLNTDYRRYYSTQQNSIATLDTTLSTLYSNPAPDPSQLGAPYVQLELIRRDLATQLSTLQTAIAALLTPAQTVAVQNLNAAAEAQPLISDAQCGFLLDPGSTTITTSLLRGFLGPFPITNLLTVPTIPPAPTGSFCGSEIYPITVRQFLNLTDAQISTLSNASAAYNDYYARKQNRMADLYVAIRDETAKPSPDPTTLGSFYAELASIGQDLQNQANQLRQTARSGLTAQQSAQLATLQNDVTLQPLIAEAESLNLLVPPLLNSGAVLVRSGDFSVLLSPPPLRQYLSLTDQQVAAIQKLNTAYQTYFSTESRRIGTVNGELSTLYANPPPDPNQLGVRYVELESIRRDIAAHLSALQQQNAAQLTKTQASAIQALNTAAVLQPLISDAQCGFLLDPLPGYAFASFLLGATIGAPSTGFVFSTLSGVPLPFPFIATTYPYIPPAPTASFCGSTVFPISVREYLNLTDAQVSSIFNQSAAYNDYYARKQDRISDVDVEIRDETAKVSPDPLALGLRYSELEGIGVELQNAQTQLRQSARATLNAQQSTQLKTLQDASALQPLISQAQGCNLLVLAPGSVSNTATFTILDPLTGGGFFCSL